MSHHALTAELIKKNEGGAAGTTWNPADIGNFMSLDPTKLTATHVSAVPNQWNAVRATLGKTTGTGSFEVLQVSGDARFSVVGITYGDGDINTDTVINNSYVYYGGGGGAGSIFKKIGSSLTELLSVPALANGDIISCEFDRPNDTVQFRRNSATLGTYDISQLTGEMFPHVSYRFDSVSTANFGPTLVSTVTVGIDEGWV